MKQAFLQGVLLGLVVSLLFACGETVNYETREKLVTAGLEGDSANAEASGPNSLPNGLSADCSSTLVQQQSEVLHFPEIPAGTTCSFGSGENLSRKDAFIRAYLRQNQDVTLPTGARLCGFTIDPIQKAMHYDDEMFFLVENRVLIATKDYTDSFVKEGLFSTFSWEALKNKVYNQNDQRGLYCVGAAEGLSACELPPTDTNGNISLSFSAELAKSLAELLQAQQVLHFSWITTGDNDDSDCRHTDIAIPVVLHYLPADAK